MWQMTKLWINTTSGLSPVFEELICIEKNKVLSWLKRDCECLIWLEMKMTNYDMTERHALWDVLRITAVDISSVWDTRLASKYANSLKSV